MSKFAVGDRVKIIPDTQFHWQAPGQVGTVIDPDHLCDGGSWVSVDWGNEYINAYPEGELVLVYESPFAECEFSENDIEKAREIINGD
jgi:hypothetical protein